MSGSGARVWCGKEQALVEVDDAGRCPICGDEIGPNFREAGVQVPHAPKRVEGNDVVEDSDDVR